jgi:hypothetical protein
MRFFALARLAVIAAMAVTVAVLNPTVASAAPITAAGYTLTLLNGTPLNGATLTAPTEAYVQGDTARVKRVQFTIDGASAPEDRTVPFTVALNLAAGSHRVLAKIWYDKTNTTIQADFTVSTITPPPTGTDPNTVNVANATQLSAALANAKPGQTIVLADGTYNSKFVINTPGTATAPITLKGSRNAILDSGAVNTGYTIHLNNADYWRLDGFTITRGNKAIMADQTNSTIIANVDAGNTGQEVIHLRNFSTDNVVRDSVIHDSGKYIDKYGEGVYLGSAQGNWATASGGQPDASDRNKVLNNTFRNTTSEAVDAKEATTGGEIRGNSMDGSGVSGTNGGDSLVDAKGNNYIIANNTVTGSGPFLLDGMQTHVAVAGWGQNNVFDANTFTLAAPGYAINVSGSPNVVRCNNTTTGTAKGLTNVACTP